MITLKLFRVLAGLISIFPVLLTAAPEFKITELDTGRARGQTVMTAFLADSNAADLIVINVSEDYEKILKLYELTANGYANKAAVEVPIAKEVISIDVGRLQNKDIIVMFTNSEAIWYDPRTGIKKSLIRFNSIYNTPVRDSVPNLDLFRDLNNDDLDDFFIPGYTGITGYIQKQDGSFSEGIAMYAPPEMNMTPSDASYQIRQNYFADMNLDGLQDIVFWVDDQLSFFSGHADGLFDENAIKFESKVPYQYGSYDEMNREMDEKQEHSNFNAKALFRLGDLDNDGITDLIVISVNSKGLLDKTMTYEIHRGYNGGSGQVVFSKKPVSSIVSKGFPFGLQEKDFNGDKKVDFLVASVEIGLGKIIRALFSGSADIDLNFYQMEGGRYPDRPNLNREVTVKFDLSSGKVSLPSILSDDLDADGYTDLIVQKGTDTLQVYPGTDNGNLFKKDSIDFKVDLPEGQNGGGLIYSQLIRLVELNNDDKPDILIRHDSKTENNRIIMMLSK